MFNLLVFTHDGFNTIQFASEQSIENIQLFCNLYQRNNTTALLFNNDDKIILKVSKKSNVLKFSI